MSIFLLLVYSLLLFKEHTCFKELAYKWYSLLNNLWWEPNNFQKSIKVVHHFINLQRKNYLRASIARVTYIISGLDMDGLIPFDRPLILKCQVCKSRGPVLLTLLDLQSKREKSNTNIKIDTYFTVSIEKNDHVKNATRLFNLISPGHNI